MDKKNSKYNTRGFIPVLLVMAFLLIPGVSSAGADDPGHTGAVMTPVNLNVTNASVPDPSVLSDYRITPEPVKVQAELNETSLPAPKGEMASGPRTIGFSIDPLSAVAAVAVIAVIGICILYYLRRERDTEEQE